MASRRPPPPQKRGQQLLWNSVADGDSAQAAAALQALVAERALPSEASQVAALLNFLEQPPFPPHQHQQHKPADSSAVLQLPALSLLARWARQQSMRPAAAREGFLLRRCTAITQQLLRSLGAAAEPRLGAACVLLLGIAAPAAPDLAEELAEAVGSTLLSWQLGPPQPPTAADATAAVGSLLPCLLGNMAAACWVLTALLHWLGGWVAPPEQPSCVAVDCLVPAYSMMRGAAGTALSRSHPAAAVVGLLRPAFSVMQAAVEGVLPDVPAHFAQQQQQQQRTTPAQAAAAVLAMGGLAEALLHVAAGVTEAVELVGQVEAALLVANEAAAPAAPGGAVSTADPAGSAAALLRDACSLAAAQLASTLQSQRLHPLLAAPSTARCQAESLLASVLTLHPLCAAAAASVPPAQASLALQRQAGCTLAQRAGSIARSLAEQFRVAGPGAGGATGMHQWLLRRVVAAARQAHQQYRRYTLTTPSDWLVAVDAAAIRQLTDRLFMTCLALVAAAWEAASTPGAQTAAQGAAAALDAAALPVQQQQQLRALLAADVAGVLADLQFCRLAAPQYAALLRAVLAGVQGTSAAAASLTTCLPCYAEMAAPCPERGNQAAWLVDSVAATKAQFLMNALVPCCAGLPQVLLEERLVPLVLLYLLHPHPSTATAAHQMFCAVLAAVLPASRREPLAAYYVRRCLEGCPDRTPPAAFGQGLATVMQLLPVGSPVALLCLRRLLDRWRELAARSNAAAVEELAALAAQQLLLVDHVLLEGAMAVINGVLQAAPATPELPPPTPVAAAALQRELVAVVRQTNDCVRKPVLVQWLINSGLQA